MGCAFFGDPSSFKLFIELWKIWKFKKKLKKLYIHRPICIMYIEWTMCLTVRRAHCLYYMYRHSAQLGLRFSLWGYSICRFPIIGWFHGYLGHANPFAFSRSDCIRWSVTFNIHDTFFCCWILAVYRSKFIGLFLYAIVKLIVKVLWTSCSV